MKKLIAMILALGMSFLLFAACSQPAASEATEAEEAPVSSAAAEEAPASSQASEEDASATGLKVSMIIPGNIEDDGFMQGGYEGLVMIQDELGAEIDYIADLEAEDEILMEAIAELAADEPDMLMAHGGQCSSAMQQMSAEYPDIQFVVMHGDVTGDNLSSYGVVQEQATFLAGAAAGLLTESNVVGHMSGLRVPAGVRARGAFAHGLQITNPEATFVTNFSGDLDDDMLAEEIANAEIEQGADIIFAMLNEGMPGVTRAVQNAGIYQVADSKNHTATDPETYIISAVSNVSLGAFTAASDFVDGTYEPGVVRPIGIETEGAIDVIMADYVPQEVVDEVDAIREQLASGEITINTDYTGPEFEYTAE